MKLCYSVCNVLHFLGRLPVKSQLGLGVTHGSRQKYRVGGGGLLAAIVVGDAV
jgi:hypothetical protein